MVRLIFSFLSSSFGLIKKAFLIILVYAVAVSLLSFFINKDRVALQNQKIPANSTTYKYINDPKLKKTDEGKIKIWVIRAMGCSLLGEACTDNPADDKKNLENSLAGNIGKTFASLYTNPPASGITWTYTSLANAGFVPKTYAWQGTGYAALMPFNPIWKIFRNISFSLLVLVVITLGFLIMFRAKLDPQAVVSIENSLPRIIISMLLITFSFAIAGFLIDMMYVVIGLAISILKPIDSTHISPDSIHNSYVYAGMGKIWEALFPDNIYVLGRSARDNIGAFWSPILDVVKLGNSIIGIFPIYLNRLFSLLAGIFTGLNILKFLNGDFPVIPVLGNLFNNVSFLGTGLGKVPSLLQLVLVPIVLFIAIGIAMFMGAGFFLGLFILLTMVFLLFRIFFMLLFGYLRLLILIIFSPIILLFEAIPGQSTFSNWIKGMVSELIMFPAVIILLIVGEIIISLPSTSSISTWGNQNVVWQPPFINGISGDNFGVLIGMGLMFLIPDLIKVLKEWIGAKPFPVQMGLGTYLGGAGSVGGAAMGTLSQAGAMAHLFPGIRNILHNVPFLGKFTEPAVTGNKEDKGPLPTGTPKIEV